MVQEVCVIALRAINQQTDNAFGKSQTVYITLYTELIFYILSSRLFSYEFLLYLFPLVLFTHLSAAKYVINDAFATCF